MSKVVLLRCHQQHQFLRIHVRGECQKPRTNDATMLKRKETKFASHRRKKTSLHSLTRPMKPSINMCMHKIWWTNMKRRGWWSLCTIKNRRRINLAATVCRRNVKRARLYKHATQATTCCAMCITHKKWLYSTYYILHECMRRAFEWLAYAVCIAFSERCRCATSLAMWESNAAGLFT